MTPLRLTWKTIEAQPRLLEAVDELLKCPGTEQHEWGLRVDRDGECYQAIRGRITPRPTPAKPRGPRPGDVIQWMFAKAGFQPTSGCGCAAFKNYMNSIGWVKCWLRRKEIVAWFTEKAREAGVELASESVTALLAAGIREVLKRKRDHSRAGRGIRTDRFSHRWSM